MLKRFNIHKDIILKELKEHSEDALIVQLKKGYLGI